MVMPAGVSPAAGTVHCVRHSVSTMVVLTDAPGRAWHRSLMVRLRAPRLWEVKGTSPKVTRPGLWHGSVWHQGIYIVHLGQQWCFLQKQRKNALSSQTSEDQGCVGQQEREKRRKTRGCSHVSPIPSLHLDLRIRSRWSQTTKLYIPGIKGLCIRALLPFLYPRYSKVNFPRKEFVLQGQATMPGSLSFL